MLEGILIALETIFTPLGVIFVFLGAFAGMILGAIPGLSGGTLMFLIMPMTLKLDPALCMGLFIGIHVGSISGGCIGSILLGIPGTGASILTCWDGYPITQRGEPVRALSAAVVANFIGTLPGILIALFACQGLAMWAVKLGPWETFSMCFCALGLIIGLSKDDVVKGVITVCIGALVSCVGTSPICGNIRLTFGSTHLYSGIPLMCCMMGLFATNRMMMEYARQSQVDAATNVKVSKFRFPKEDIRNNLGNIIRTFFTSVFIGFVPGMGAGVSCALSYSNEKAIAERKLKPGEPKFGEGNIGGVFAAEVANNATIGGALIPMIALGIPGDGMTAIFLSILTMQGVSCGPLLIRNNPEIAYTVFIGAMVAAVWILLLQTTLMPLFPRMLKAPYHFLYPAIIIVSFIGAYTNQTSISSLVIVLVFCAIGVFMAYFKLSMVPFMMGYVMSNMLETQLRQAMNFGNGIASFLERPIAMVFIVLGTIIIINNLFGNLIRTSLKKLPIFNKK